jgi:uncharacterized protein YecE (DUF72 family)
MPQREWLPHYAHHFHTVEINNTFYRLPAETSVAMWVERTPPGFVFTVKASRYLTHVKRLRGVADGVKRFFEPLSPLLASGKFGPILWQLPPDFQRADERLAETLDLVSEHRNAVEFRHPSWFAGDVYALLRERGAALVIGDHPERPFQTRELTADWTLVRFHYGARGRGGNYSRAELDTWRRRIAAWRSRIEVFAYFNNDWNAYAIGNARRLGASFAPQGPSGGEEAISS